MALDYAKIMSTSFDSIPFSYGDLHTMLYAQSIGFGRDPLDEKELPYVCEQGTSLRTVPSMANTLVPDLLPADLGWDYSQILHGEQRLQLFRPLPAAADILINKRVAAVYDRGPSRGAVVLIEAEARLAKDDSALFSLGSTVVARADGGFGGPRGNIPSPHRVPHREPDLSCDLPTQPDQALLYRLTGDRNPLHASPGAARKAGFNVPILHGLCTYGVACHAILKTICDYDYTLISEIDARFSAPVLPGDTISTDMWQDGNVVSFRCTARERNSIVVKNGRCVLRS